MQQYHATLEYETKKGNLKTAKLDVEAKNIEEATRRARFEVMNNGQRQAKKVKTVSAILANPPENFQQGRIVVHGDNGQQRRKRGFFTRMFGR